eukprot:PhF_6_TR34159/c0_g1_i4/m.49922
MQQMIQPRFVPCPTCKENRQVAPTGHCLHCNDCIADMLASMVPACVCGTPRNFEHVRCWYCAKEHMHDPEAPTPAPREANPSNIHVRYSGTMRTINKTYAERNKRCREDNAKLVKENEALKLRLMIAKYEKELSVKDATIATLQKELAMQKNARQQITINNYNCAKCRPSVDF